METRSSTTTLSPSFSLVGFIGILFFEGILKWVTGFNKFYSSSHSFFHSKFGKLKCWSEKKSTNSELVKKLCVDEKVEDGKLSSKDVEMVMGKLRIVCNHDEEIIHERLGSDEASALFVDEEPSVEEVKEAFDVFDENRDGFVDAEELQRVLCRLGCREGSELVDCEKMIRVFDENRDGRVDFNEFVKLMEKSFC